MAGPAVRYWKYSREADDAVLERQPITQDAAETLFRSASARSAYKLVVHLRGKRSMVWKNGASEGQRIEPRFAKILRNVIERAKSKPIRFTSAHESVRASPESAQQETLHARKYLDLGTGAGEHDLLMPTEDDERKISWNPNADVSYCIVIAETVGPQADNPQGPPAYAGVNLGHLAIRVVLLEAWYDPGRELALTVHQVDPSQQVGFGASRLWIGDQVYFNANATADAFEPWKRPCVKTLFPYGERLFLEPFRGPKGLCQAFSVPRAAMLKARNQNDGFVTGKLAWYPHTQGNTSDNALFSDVYFTYPLQGLE